MENREKNNFIIPMDFLGYDFRNALAEYEEHGKILWEIPGKPNDETSKAANIKIGDVFYFYVNHLVSQSDASTKARILLCGEMIEAPKLMKRKEVYKTAPTKKDPDGIISGFAIGNIRILKSKFLKDDKYLNMKHIFDLGLTVLPQGGRWPSTSKWNPIVRVVSPSVDLVKGEEGAISQELLNKLEESFEKKSIDENNKNAFHKMIAHFERKCFFSDKERSKAHRTFRKNNGMDYFEAHHFILKSKESDENFGSLVDNESNLISLCAGCHREIHLSENARKNEMIEQVFESEGMQSLLQDSINRLGREKCLEEIKKLYLNETEQQKEKID